MDIEFDPAKDAQNRAKHGISLAAAAELDWSAMVTREDVRRSYGEPRLIGMSTLSSRVHVVVFVERGESTRVISLRRANNREIARYESQKAQVHSQHTG